MHFSARTSTEERFMIKLKIIFGFLLGLMLLNQAKADLWQVTQAWSPEMEIKYQDWLKANAKIDIFEKKTLADGITPNPYYGLTTDCADTVYSLRVIFSYENGLPWAIRNPANPRKLITQATKKYDKLPAGSDRLKAFLTYLYDMVGTSSIANDTYPVSINNLHTGVILLTSKINHHSWTIADIDEKGNPRLIFNSTVGKASGPRLQQRRTWPNPFWVFQPEEKLTDPNDPNSAKILNPVYKAGSYAGFRYWVPVDKLLSDFKELPDYSDDQYELDLASWKMTIQKKYAQKAETLEEVIVRLLSDACDDIKQRITAVKEADLYRSQLKEALAKQAQLESLKKALENPDDLNGDSDSNSGNLSDGVKQSTIDDKTKNLIEILTEFQKAKNKPADERCLIASKYDQLSTPSRDRRLFDGIMVARAYYVYGVRTYGEKSFSKTRNTQFKKIFTQPLRLAREESDLENQGTALSKYSICNVKIGSQTLDLAEIKRRIFKSFTSPNPNEDVIGRWGGHGAERSELAKSCDTYGETYDPYDLEKSESQANDEVSSYIQHK